MLKIEELVKTFAGEKRRRGDKPEPGDAPVGANRVRAVDNVSFEVNEGEMFTLLGPSGCGKTTTLRSVAGLERPDSGEIRVGDRVLFARGGGRTPVHVPVNRRGLGMVFQSYAIWPHMKVFDNVAFPLKVMPKGQRPGRAEVKEKVARVLEVMELGHLAGRPATKLSGGQQQRLALARALVTEPSLVLLDEPLSNLDAKLRDSLRLELKRLQRENGITSIYVTHDQVEALALSSRIAVMRDGVIMQIGAPRDIYLHPANRFVAEFIGTSNFVEGKVEGTEHDDLLVVGTPYGTLRVAGQGGLPAGSEVILAIRPEAIELSEGAPTGAAVNELAGNIAAGSFLGDAVDHLVVVGDRDFRIKSNPTVFIPPASDVVLTIDPAQITLIPSG